MKFVHCDVPATHACLICEPEWGISSEKRARNVSESTIGVYLSVLQKRDALRSNQDDEKK